MKSDNWFASCPRGLESLLFQELEQLGALTVKETVAGCYFAGPLAVAYRVCLWSRLANRVLLNIGDISAGEDDNRLQALRELPWEDVLPLGCSFVVDFQGRSRAIRNTQFGAQLVKDAIVDRFRDIGRARPEVARRHADVRFQVRMRKGRVTAALDVAGESLHQRGYRQEAGGAPLKENLAAALLLRADWPGIASRGGALVDPMCGSGTLLIEAALMVADMAPGLNRKHWGFERQTWHNPSQWQAILKDAQGRAEKGLARELPEIRGYDADKRVIHKARANIERAGLEDRVRVVCKPLEALKKPTHKPLPLGLVITNPPYGERLGERSELPELYRLLGEVLLSEFGGWHAAVFTGDKGLGKAMAIRSHRQYSLFNGPLASVLLLFQLEESERLRHVKPEEIAVPGPAVEADAELTEGAQMFINRMRKNLKQVERWARREQVSCYRVYDADMPEYAVAVDRYENAWHVAEYQAPAGIDPDSAARRLGEIRAAMREVAGEQKVYYKTRQRQKGRSQYEKAGDSGATIEVAEGQARLLVNLQDYLDTGLFLDHRPLRLRLAEQAKNRDFLNLFCYTATASVHAAMGGARSTTSVDMSNAYLGWASKNFALNGISVGQSHQLERADCLAWLSGQQADWDLVLLDPPSFSNSKRMEDSFDVQRDHPALLRAAMACLREEGILYFSNNRRSFKIDQSLLQEFQVEDISAATIDFDFRRNQRIHHCWTFRHRPGFKADAASQVSAS